MVPVIAFSLTWAITPTCEREQRHTMASQKTIELDGCPVGEGHAPYIAAEVSANHDGSLEKAKDIIASAAQNGADAVKLQTYTADTITIKSDRPEFRIEGGLWDGYTLYDLYEKAHTPYAWHGPLFDHARANKITCFSSPFDETAVDLLENLNAPFYKIASFEMTDLPLVRRVARTRKPMVMSTGMATMDEIKRSLEAAKQAGSGKIILLHCISGYPTPLEDANLRLITDLADQTNALIGLSDHTLDATAATVATALGACFIEKHFTLDRSDGGVDADFSMEPGDLAHLVKTVKGAWNALGNGERNAPSAQDTNRKFRRSIYSVAQIKKGEAFTPENVRCIRPSKGLSPDRYDDVLATTATRDIAYGTPLEEADLA